MAKIIIIIPSFVWEQNETKRRSKRKDCGVKINYLTLHWYSSWILHSKLSQFSSLYWEGRNKQNFTFQLKVLRSASLFVGIPTTIIFNWSARIPCGQIWTLSEVKKDNILSIQFPVFLFIDFLIFLFMFRLKVFIGL